MNKKLKIAVQMFGHLRTFAKCAPKLKKHLLNHYNCDIFMHSWDKIDHDTQTWHKYKSKGKDISSEDLKSEVLAFYPITDIKMEQQKYQDLGIFKTIKFEHSIHGISSMFYSMHASNKLREEYQQKTKVNYDFVLMIRPDILLKENFNIESFISRLTEEEVANTIFSSGRSSSPILNDIRFIGGIDIMFFGKPDTISKVLNNHNKIIDKAIEYKDAKIFGPEYLLYKQIIEEGFNFFFIDYKIYEKCAILRSHSEKKAIRLHVRKKYTKIFLLEFLPKIIRLKVTIGIYYIDVSIGNFT